MITFEKKLRDMAMELPITDPVRGLLQQAADDVDDALVKAYKLRTLSAMQHLNGVVAKASRVLKNARPPQPTNPTSGGDEEWAEQRRMAA